MKTLLILASLLFVSCGNNTQILENKYDDTQIQAILVIQDARIKALEARIDAYITDFDLVTIEFSEKLSNLETNLANRDEILENNIQLVNTALGDLQGKQIEALKICSSNEHLIKQGNNFYAVYMVSNNYGTFLGKLAENVVYRTTDNVGANFKIINNRIVCQ
jgi:uncharacterized protein YcfL